MAKKAFEDIPPMADDETESEEETAAEESTGIVESAQAVLDAIKADDAKALADALTDLFIQADETVPHKEAGE
jgi:hypothetical protein